MEGLSVEPCGLFVDLDLPFLAASPDGLVRDDAVVEVKCPYTGRNLEISVRKEFSFLEENEDGEFCLKKGHKYYAQVQGQLAITSRQLCYFVVYTLQDCVVVKVPVDSHYCSKTLMPLLYDFYTRHFRPYIASTL